MGRSILAAFFCCALALVASGDEVRLIGGERLSGEWSVDRIVIDSAQGEILVPVHHVQRIRREGEGFVVRLSDGSDVDGIPRLDVVELRTGLVVRRIPFAEVEEIRLETTTDELVASTLAAGGFVEVDRLPLEAVVQSPCPLRLRLKLPSLFKEGVWSSAQTRTVECDDAISIASMSFAFRQGRNGAGELEVKPMIRVDPPQDKLVDITLALTLDGQPAGSARRDDVDAEEGRTTWKRFTIDLPAEIVTAWSAGLEAFLDLELSAVDH